MPKLEREPKNVPVRLESDEQEILEGVERLGLARNTSEAIRWAIRMAPSAYAYERAAAARKTGPARLDLMPGGGVINVILGDRQRVLARVWDTDGKVILNAPRAWAIEPASLAKIVQDGESTFVEGKREGRGMLTVRSGQLEEHAFLDVWEDRPDLTRRVPTAGVTRADAEARTGRRLGR